MDNEKEMQSFLSKFNNLWKCGYTAELSIKCNAGQAFLHLDVGLGYAVDARAQQFDHVNQLKKNVSPSRLRRRIRRENLRKNILVPSENGGDVTSSVEAEITESVIESIENTVVITEDTTDDRNSRIIGTEVLENSNVDAESVSAVKEIADITLVDTNDRVATGQEVTNGETEVLENGNVSSESVSAVEETADIALVDSNDRVATDQIVTNGETETVTPSENGAASASIHVSGKDVADARNEDVSALPGKEVAHGKIEDVKVLPDIVEVYALASLRNSPIQA